MFILKLVSSIFQANNDHVAQEQEIAETEPIKDELPKVMLFREVVAPTNRVGDLFWLPGSDGEKVLAVNFDFEKCGWTGELKVNISINNLRMAHKERVRLRHLLQACQNWN